jgi:hypothetical protein
MLESSSREPETLEQSRGSQTERRIALAGIFECRIEFALFALESVVPALGIRATELERRLKQRVKVTGSHAGMLRAVLQVILLNGEPEPSALVLNEPSCYHFRVLDPP